MMVLERRKPVAVWLVVLMIMAMLSLYGCTGSAPELNTTAPSRTIGTMADSMAVLKAESETPPPVVPVGIDTSFVVAADSSFGVVLNADTLAVLEEETRKIEVRETVVDTLAAVARFLQLASSGDDRHAMSAADSQAVGHLVLRGLAGNDAGASLMLSLDETVRGLDAMVQESDRLGSELAWDSDDPARQAQSREVQVAVLGFSRRSTELRERLEELKGSLEFQSQTADSARAQQEIGRLVQEFNADLDRMINEMGRASRNISSGALSPTTLRGLRDNLRNRRDAVMEFEARWQQFAQTGSLDLANPAQPYNANRMLSLLRQMDDDLAYLTNLAQDHAQALETASTFQSELESRRKAEDYIKQVQKTLVELKKRNQNLGQAYGRLAARYWKDRLQQVAADKNEREELYASLERMVERAGGTAHIRERADLLNTYRRNSDRLLELRRQHLKKVADHDRLSENVQAALAADLYNRARVLGEPDDYRAAIDAYAELARSQPGQHTWYYQMAGLAWGRSQEDWAQANGEADDSIAATVLWLDRCEEVLLQRFDFDANMDETQALLSGDDTTPVAEAVTPVNSPVARAALFLPEDGRWYYRRFVTRARDDLARLGEAIVDEDVRRWMLNIDVLRKRVAFAENNGDEFLYRYSRQAMLSENMDAGTAAELLEHWSWDGGHLALRRRWSHVDQMPDSTVALAQVKRDSLENLGLTARTDGVKRQLAWNVGVTEFLRTEEYDRGLQRMHDLLKEVEARPNLQPEVGAIDSTITAVYPVFLYNRGTYYQQEGQRREAFYCFLGVAEEYATDLKTVATARYSAATMLADGNKRGALGLVRAAINEALRVIGEDPRNFDMETLVAMYELRQGLAGDLGLFQEAVQARNEAQSLKTLLEQSTEVSP